MLTTVRMQEKGQVTIPNDVRRRLKLKKGDMVTFLDTSEGVVICSLDQAIQELQRLLAMKLGERSQSLKDLLSVSQNLGDEAATEKFGLSTEERSLFYQVLQLRAQIALESIRNSAEANETTRLSDAEINAEIQAVRRGS
jgi:AbrB family looped-hinge helix DNA binding protein